MLGDREFARAGHTAGGRNSAGTEFALSIGMEVSMRFDQTRALVRRAAASLLLGLLPLAGCSFVFVHGAPSDYHPRQGPPPCDRMSPLPGADVAGAVGAGLAALVIAVARTPLWYDCVDDDCSPPEVDYTASKRLGLASLGLLASSFYGAIQKTDCREAHTVYDASLPSLPHARVERLAPPRAAVIAPVIAPVTPPRPAPAPSPPPPLRLDCRPWRAQYQAATTPEQRRDVIEMTPPVCRVALGLRSSR
jgi:hypothetical protein